VPALLNADILDRKFLQKARGVRKLFYKAMPLRIAQLLEVCWVARHYDALVSWGEDVGVPLAALMKATRMTLPHVSIFPRISDRTRRIPLKLLRFAFNRIVLMSSVQREYAVHRLGIPASRVTVLQSPVDQKFWRPREGPCDMICAAGGETSDYSSVIEALRGSAIPCHIAAGPQCMTKSGRGRGAMVSFAGPLPDNITVGFGNPADLREVYARSRFVVISFIPDEAGFDARSILEAMSMGKAVICSRVRGHEEFLREGETGFSVPPEDSSALRFTIEYLWSHPEIAERMGCAARAEVEQHHTVDAWVSALWRTVEECYDQETGPVHSPGCR
jgi:hypothetical protein